jgi:preprotein translocase subunit SecG
MGLEWPAKPCNEPRPINGRGNAKLLSEQPEFPMQTVVVVIHLMVVVALVGVVLLQRSEGGGLGIGGGSGFMTARGAANALTRTTAILAALFFATSLVLSILARYGEKPTDILDQAPPAQNGAPANSGKGILDQLGGKPATPPATGTQKPAGGAPATSTAPATGGQATPPANTAQPGANGGQQPKVPNE